MIWTTQPIDEPALRHFAEGFGGYWNDVVGDEAVIERGDARVFISSVSSGDDENAMPDDVARATLQLGHVPASMLSMRIGHADGSTELAEEVASRAVQRWGGFLDRNLPL